jgi:hypothetical protein
VINTDILIYDTPEYLVINSMGFYQNLPKLERLYQLNRDDWLTVHHSITLV